MNALKKKKLLRWAKVWLEYKYRLGPVTKQNQNSVSFTLYINIAKQLARDHNTRTMDYEELNKRFLTY